MKENSYLIENLIIGEGATQLQESAPAIIYHSTSINAVKKIILTNQFNLTSKFSSSADSQAMGQNKKLFFLSTATSKLGGYRVGRLSNALLVLDGDKLNNRYQAVPIDYWGPNWRQHIKNSNMHPSDKNHAYATSDEQEIRILSDTPIIPNARKYILEIHLLAPKPESGSTSELIDNIDMTYDQLYNTKVIVLNEIGLYDIPIYIYGNEKNFKLLNKTKAYKYKKSSSSSLLDAFIKSSKIPNWNNSEDIEKIIKETDDNLFSEFIYRGSGYIEDLAKRLKSELQYKKGEYSDSMIKNLSVFSKLMKKYKTNSIEDLLLKVWEDHTKKIQQ